VSFVEWTFLLGAAAVAGPIVAHLWAKPRFRPMPFTLLRFLRISQDQGRSRRRIADWLILVLRCLIVILVALLFARPVWVTKAPAPAHRSTVFLAVDDSASMAYGDKQGSIMARACQAAAAQIKAADRAGVYHVYRMASGRWGRDLTQDQALALVKDLRPQPRQADVDGFLAAVEAHAAGRAQDERTCAILVTDLTPSVVGQLRQAAGPIPVQEAKLVPVVPAGPADNASIVDARWAGTGQQAVLLDVVVRNTGQTRQVRGVAARLGDRMSEPVAVDLGPGEQGAFALTLPSARTENGPASLPIEVRLTGADGLAWDDVYRVGVTRVRAEERQVAVIEDVEDQGFLFEAAVRALAGRGLGGMAVTRAVADRASGGVMAGSGTTVFSGIPGWLAGSGEDLRRLLSRGGRVVFFLTDPVASDSVERLWDQGVLPARPGRRVDSQTGVATRHDLDQTPGLDREAARSLANYRLDGLCLNSHYTCEVREGGACAWPLADGEGLVYTLTVGEGTSILVNTSIDTSMGNLAKSPVFVPFVQCLLGADREVLQVSGTSEGPVFMPVLGAGGRQTSEAVVETCDGRRHRARIRDGRVVVADPNGLGWVKAVTEPVVVAGVNLPEGETDLMRLLDADADHVLAGVFRIQDQTGPNIESAGMVERSRPMWREIAWALLALAMVEPILARLARRT